jgi:hypothetical protein
MRYLNINFDDVHPESSKHIADCGGDFDRGVNIFKLLDNFLSSSHSRRREKSSSTIRRNCFQIYIIKSLLGREVM